MKIQITDLVEIAAFNLSAASIVAIIAAYTLGFLLVKFNINKYWRALYYSILGTVAGMIHFSNSNLRENGIYNNLGILDTLDQLDKNPDLIYSLLTIITFLFIYTLTITALSIKKKRFRFPGVFLMFLIIIIINSAISVM